MSLDIVSNMETTQVQATEFQRRRNLPGVEVRYMNGQRFSEVILTLMGKEIGSKTDILKRNVIVSTMFNLPVL